VEKAYKFGDIAALANTVFSQNDTDGGMPRGAKIGPILIVSGDSSGVVVSTKKLIEFKWNF
jgi:hypothetical protein